MIMDDQPTIKGLRFNLRTVLVCVAFIALAIGWYTSMSQQRIRSAWLFQQLMNARSQIQLAESRTELQADVPADSDPMAKGVLSGVKLEGVNLRDAVIGGGTSAFQRARFDRSDLSNASLTGGAASFQGASFNNAILRNPSVVNFLDGCALTIPCHVPGAGPVGLMVVGQCGEDRRLLAVGLAIESALQS